MPQPTGHIAGGDGLPAPSQMLLDWFAEQRRDLPWRDTRDPWAVLLSELMLQQTQVSRVRERFGPLLARLPTPEACARAPVAEVIRAWQGLGYNRRAVNLHRAANQIVDRHAGVVPGRLEQLLDLAGVGPYTARAVLAFAFERDVGVVDTNAGRVLARAIAGRTLSKPEVQSLADAQVPAGAGWLWNQAVLDLGATVCTKRAPKCHMCPIQPWCVWAQSQLAQPNTAIGDPAAGSAGVTTRQSKFEGSDRQGRGRLLRAMSQAPVSRGDIAQVAGWPDSPQRAVRVAEALVAEGLAQYVGETMTLPVTSGSFKREAGNDNNGDRQDDAARP
ncbi:MAG: hypothetical protein WD576_00400 [Nitriliruptoraceae bacterium]